MKKYNPIYYLLFMMLIMGTFASMAQNDYGFKMLGFVAFAFAFVFGLQLLFHLRHNDGKERIRIAEGVCLIVLATVIGMRIFYIRFPFAEAVFGSFGLVLIFIYGYTLYTSFHLLNTGRKTASLVVVLFHASIISYLISLTAVPFFPTSADNAGIAGFILLIAFLITGFLNLRNPGANETAFRQISRFRDRSLILLTLFVLFTAYVGLTKKGALPQMYHDVYPQAYYELVNKEDTGAGKKVKGRYESEVFKEKYEEFVRNNRRK